MRGRARERREPDAVVIGPRLSHWRVSPPLLDCGGHDPAFPSPRPVNPMPDDFRRWSQSAVVPAQSKRATARTTVGRRCRAAGNHPGFWKPIPAPKDYGVSRRFRPAIVRMAGSTVRPASMQVVVPAPSTQPRLLMPW